MAICDITIKKDIAPSCDDPIVPGLEQEGVIMNRADVDFGAVTFNAGRIVFGVGSGTTESFTLTNNSASPVTWGTGAATGRGNAPGKEGRDPTRSTP